ncbi:MAG: hydroxymethylpyrimidine/phosphomethylpyrimidine kinase [Candidatus Cloacimonetes bacterium]|nr:hydroxymethylpyrimidine/phosphomethylpyrimidine kinase [Candidatus Cloacimonadota bacterium]
MTFVLCVSASDSSGGAGMQRDVAVARAHGCHALSALTGITVQTHSGLLHAEAVSLALLRRQLEACLTHYPVAAVKVGALCDVEQVGVLADALSGVTAPIVLDPVFAPTAGAAFLHDVAAYRERLLPLAAVVTPNRQELARLAELPVDTPEQVEAAVLLLTVPVFVTGGHFAGEEIVEWLVRRGEVDVFRKPRLSLRETHGTGCALSTALACRLAQGEPLSVACRAASAWVGEAQGRCPS